MAISKTIALAGGFDAPAYLLIRKTTHDRMTGAVTVEVWSFPDEESRRAWEDAFENWLKVEETMKMRPIDGPPEKHEEISRARITARQAAQFRLGQCKQGAAHGALNLSPEEAAPAIKNGAVDIAALYEILKKEGGPLCGGEDA